MRIRLQNLASIVLCLALWPSLWFMVVLIGHIGDEGPCNIGDYVGPMVIAVLSSMTFAFLLALLWSKRKIDMTLAASLGFVSAMTVSVSLSLVATAAGLSRQEAILDVLVDECNNAVLSSGYGFVTGAALYVLVLKWISCKDQN